MGGGGGGGGGNAHVLICNYNWFDCKDKLLLKKLLSNYIFTNLHLPTNLNFSTDLMLTEKLIGLLITRPDFFFQVRVLLIHA